MSERKAFGGESSRSTEMMMMLYSSAEIGLLGRVVDE